MMQALVEIAGHQFEVEKNQELVVPNINAEPGATVEFGNILLYKSGEDVQFGAPYITGTVKAKVIEHGKSDKILVFHKKRRKGHRKLNGYRGKLTKIEITDINVNN